MKLEVDIDASFHKCSLGAASYFVRRNTAIKSSINLELLDATSLRAVLPAAKFSSFSLHKQSSKAPKIQVLNFAYAAIFFLAAEDRQPGWFLLCSTTAKFSRISLWL
jgi:hypothetical protein